MGHLRAVSNYRHRRQKVPVPEHYRTMLVPGGGTNFVNTLFACTEMKFTAVYLPQMPIIHKIFIQIITFIRHTLFLNYKSINISYLTYSVIKICL